MEYNNYIPDIDENDNGRVPEVKQNEISQKFAIGVSVGIMIWILAFIVLKSTGVISGLVMRICIYPVILAILIFYMVVKNKNNTIK